MASSASSIFGRLGSEHGAIGSEVLESFQIGLSVGYQRLQLGGFPRQLLGLLRLSKAFWIAQSGFDFSRAARIFSMCGRRSMRVE